MQQRRKEYSHVYLGGLAKGAWNIFPLVTTAGGCNIEIKEIKNKYYFGCKSELVSFDISIVSIRNQVNVNIYQNHDNRICLEDHVMIKTIEI